MARPYLFLSTLFVCAPILAVAAVPIREQEDVQEPDAEDVSPPDVPVTNAEPLPPAASVPQDKSPTGQNPVAPQVAGGIKGDAEYDTVLLQGLNKVTARTQLITVPIGKTVSFGTLEVAAQKCWKAAPEEQPENAAYLSISEAEQGEKAHSVFSGWMFSSSPGLSSLEHPFYDITVVGCQKMPATPAKK